MNESLNISPDSVWEEASRIVELEKYLSLISTLRGQEEFLLDEKGIIISSNLETVNITGYEEFEVIGEHFGIFYPKEDKEKVHEDLRRAAALEQIVVSGFHLKKRGTAFWAKIKIKCLREHNSRAFYKVLLQDTTHRALSNLRVQTIRDEYLAIFNNPFVGSFKFRMSDYRMMMWNKKAGEITGRPNSEEIYFNQLFSSDTEFTHFLKRLRDEKRVEGVKLFVRADAGKERWIMISANYFIQQGFVEGIIIDITDQHNQMNELQRVNTELDNFTYHSSHDLRAPLTTILGLVNLGMKEQDINAAQNYFEMIKNRILHMDVLLKDLISVSYNNTKDVIPEVFQIENELKEIVKEYDYPGNKCIAEIEIKQPTTFRTDTVRMRTILRNLISNAFKYYNPEVATPYVKINVIVDESRATFQLVDNGIGIEWSLKDRVYEMFYRGTTRSNGTGLGLYIVKAMVEKLNGSIAMESAAGQGTAFLLTIPNEADLII